MPPAPDADRRLAEDAAAAAEAAAAEAEARAAVARARADRLRGLPASADADSDDNPASAPRTLRRPWHRLRSRLPGRTAIGVGVLVVAICASGGAVGALAWRHHVADLYRQRTAEAASAARAGVQALMSLDFNNAEHDVQRIIDHSTGALRDNYQQMSASMATDLQESKVATSVTINDVAVKSVTGERAEVLIAARTVRTAADGSNEDPYPWRVRLTLTREGGQLKMSDVEFVQ